MLNFEIRVLLWFFWLEKIRIILKAFYVYPSSYQLGLTEKVVLSQGQRVVGHNQPIRGLQKPHCSAIQNGGTEETLLIHSPQHRSTNSIHHHPIWKKKKDEGESARKFDDCGIQFGPKTHHHELIFINETFSCFFSLHCSVNNGWYQKQMYWTQFTHFILIIMYNIYLCPFIRSSCTHRQYWRTQGWWFKDRVSLLLSPGIVIMSD